MIRARPNRAVRLGSFSQQLDVEPVLSNKVTATSFISVVRKSGRGAFPCILTFDDFKPVADGFPDRYRMGTGRLLRSAGVPAAVANRLLKYVGDARSLFVRLAPKLFNDNGRDFVG